MLTSAPRIWLDGDLINDASAPLMGHAVQRGSLVFDVGSFREAEDGGAMTPALYRARDHVARFVRSTGIVGLEVPFNADALVEAAARVVSDSGLHEGLVRWSAFYATHEPDLIPRDNKVRVAVAVQRHPTLQDPAVRRPPIKVAIFDDARKAPPDVLPPNTKAAGAYLGPMLAKRRALAAGADDVILLDRDGDIAEAPIANAFAVVAGALWTPPLGLILPGITRDSVLLFARALGIHVREERLPLETFLKADEAFLTSTSLPLAPIGSVNGSPIGSGTVGPITSRLSDRIIAARRGADPERRAWLTFVR